MNIYQFDVKWLLQDEVYTMLPKQLILISMKYKSRRRDIYFITNSFY